MSKGSEVRSAAALKRLEAKASSREAWEAVYAAEEAFTKIDAAAKLAATAITEVESSFRAAFALTDKLRRCAEALERGAYDAEAAFAAAVQKYPQEGD